MPRADANSVDAILAMVNTDTSELTHVVENGADTIFTWDYQKGRRPQLETLYERAKRNQWNAETDIDWSIDVDPERVLSILTDGRGESVPRSIREHPDLPMRLWNEKEWTRFGVESVNWRLSQFLHGEQGALVCTAKIVETVPWIDAKYYAATQVMDEARHVEVFGRYLDTKLAGRYPINPHLRMLLDDIINDNRWDMTYLGMQIMVEGLALAAFGFMYQFCDDPLLKQILRYVMADEARHVAFGVLSLKEFYGSLTEAEIRERQEFAFDAAVRMRDRLFQQEVWHRLGVDVPKTVHALMHVPPEDLVFQQMLFSKIVPNCKKLGLLDAGSGWLRDRFTEIGVIKFEDQPDDQDLLPGL
ncbi:MAG TPA: ferritin-like domain-containing protein [Acidimicrobiales bacterium]|nr:ferritin-like domain-containing protein [Acidimicrobiales bacterium]